MSGSDLERLAKLQAFNNLTNEQKDKAFENIKKGLFTNHFPNKQKENGRN